MDLPPREKLLDIDWLVDKQVREGLDAFKQCVRAGADAYGGAVAAIADIVQGRSLGIWKSETDVRRGTSCRMRGWPRWPSNRGASG